MSKKMKGFVLDSVDAKNNFKHQTLVQEFGELQKEANAMRSKLELVKKRKLTLAAEVRFLRRRYKYLMKSKPMMSSKEQKLVQTANFLPNLSKNNAKEAIFSRKKSTLQRLPPTPTPKPKKKHQIEKETTPYGASLQVHSAKEDVQNNLASTSSFDLTKNNSWVEATLPSRAPIFDLNEISNGDEDLEGNGEALKLEETKKGFIRSDEHQNDMKLSICRDSGEGSSNGEKRKISWGDQVALRV